jgi:precorrin-8X/cobalt-precorrin-8 methylmutase
MIAAFEAAAAQVPVVWPERSVLLSLTAEVLTAVMFIRWVGYIIQHIKLVYCIAVTVRVFTHLNIGYKVINLVFETVRPEDIEKRSMEIITSELKGRTWPEPRFSIIKRCIHTSADFDYADNLKFSDDAENIGIRAIRNGANIITDTKMAAAGINKNVLGSFGGSVHCFISDDDVIKEAKERGETRASISMEKASKLGDGSIFALGNAPTALFSLCGLVKEGKIRPALIIGVPVGFVNVVESKEAIMELGIPYIVAAGRKGGSNISAAICNALLYHKG